MAYRVLLLGKPFHGETREVEHAGKVLRLEHQVAEEVRSSWTGSGSGFAPRRAEVAEYVRVDSPGMPDGALVYREAGYLPQEDDAELVLLTFG